MLIFSSGVILYGSLFRGGEVAFLLTMPIREERIFQHEFQHAVMLSSWGFLLLGSPMLVAYGMVAEAPWYYYAMVLPMLAAFVFIPAGIGAMLLLAIMHLFPRRRIHLLALAPACWRGPRPGSAGRSSRGRKPICSRAAGSWKCSNRLQLAQGRPLPNWWLSSGLLEAAGEAWAEGMMFLALLIANALFFRELAGMFAARVYRKAYWEAAGLGSPPARVQAGWFDRALNRCLGFLSPPVRLMLMKDVRLVPPRSVAMVPIPDLALPAVAVLHERASHELHDPRFPVGEHRELHEPFGRGPADVDLHDAVRLPPGQPGRPPLLAAGPAAAEARVHPVGQIPLLRRLPVGALRPADPAERLAAGHSGDVDGTAPGDFAPAVPGPLGHRRRTGRQAARDQRAIAFADRSRLRRHVEPGDRHDFHRAGPGAGHVALPRLPGPADGFHLRLQRRLRALRIAVRSWLIAGSLASLVVSGLAALLPMWIGIRTFRRQEFH